MFRLRQVIKEATHILENSSSCIDFKITSQPNLITESRVHPSLHPDYHHQIIYAEFNLQFYYPPQYYREVWHYNETNAELIRLAVNQLNWQKIFLDKCVNENVKIFNETVLNMLKKFTLHETALCHDRDPPWFNNKIKYLIREKT